MAFPAFISTLLTAADNINTNTFVRNQAILTTFLQHTDNATIRVLVASGPGMGHQANTVNIIWSLVAAGFNQSVQLVYDDTPTVPTTIQKLAILIPGLDPANPVNVTINGITISFISTTAFAASTTQVNVTLGITGGYDAKDVDLGRTMKSKLFLKLQPYCWPQPNVLYAWDETATPSVQTDLSGIAALGNFVFTRQNYYLPLPAMSAGDYTAFTTSDPTKVDPYKAIIAACAGATPAANMMPVYGIGDNDGKIESLSNAAPESVLFNLIAGVAYNQTNSANAKLQKGAIIVVVATVSDACYTNLGKMLDGTTSSVALNTYSTAQTLAARVKVIPFNDATFSACMTTVSTTANQILVIKMNGLPAKPFNFIYYKSTLPCVFEGKGTAALVLNLPVPFFYLTSSNSNIGTVYPTLPLQNKQLAKAPAVVPGADAKNCNTAAYRLTEAASVTNTKLEAQANASTTSFYSAAAFIESTADPMNATAVYLATLPAYFHVPSNDKLLKALFYLLQHTTQP